MTSSTLAKPSSFLKVKALWLQIGSGAIWSIAGSVLSQTLTLMATITVARTVGREPFGEYVIVLNTMLMIGVLSGTSLGLTSSRYVGELKARAPDRAGRIIVLTLFSAASVGLGLTAIIVAAANLLATGLMATPALSPLLRLGAPLVALNCVLGVQTGILTGFEAFSLVAKANVIRGLSLSLSVILGAFLSDVQGALTGAVIGTAFTILWFHKTLLLECKRHSVPLSHRGALEETGVLLHFSLPAFISNLLVAPMNWLMNVLLVRSGSGMAEVAVLNVAVQWRNLCVMIPTQVAQVVLPVISRLRAHDGDAAARALILKMLLMSLAVATPVGLVILLFSDPIMSAYGAGFAGRSTVMQITVVTGCLIFIQTPLGQLVAAREQMWFGLMMNAAWMGTLLVAVLFPYYRGTLTADSVAAAFLIAYLCHSLWSGLYVAYSPVGRLRDPKGQSQC